MKFSVRRMLAIAQKELRHVLRDPRMRPVLFVLPVVQLILLGYAANLDVVNVRTSILDRDHTPTSRAIAARVAANTAFSMAAPVHSEAEAEDALGHEGVEIVVVIPKGSDRALRRGESVPIPIWLDGIDSNRATVTKAYAQAVLDTTSRDLMPAGPRPPVGVTLPNFRVLYNPAMQSKWFMVPGVVVMVVTVLTTLLSAMAIVKERETGTIEQLIVTPIQSTELIFGKLLPFTGLGLFVTILVAVAGVVVFHVPFRGNPLVLALMCLLYLASTLGVGLAASTFSQTQQQAMLSVILILMPSFLLGGVFYPISNMPEWAQMIAALTPLRYFIVMVRAVFLKGSGFGTLSLEASYLAIIGAVVLSAAVLRFRKRST